MREKFLRRMRNDNPDWLGDPWDCFTVPPASFGPVGFDPVTLLDPRAHGEYKDAWGVHWKWPEDEPAPTPNITPETKVVKDIEKWRESLKAPSIENIDWKPFKAMYATLNREEYLVMCINPTGMFDFSTRVMGFEDSLMAYILEPDAMNEMLAYYTDFKLRQAELVCDHLKPDVINSHDDWGNKKSLFLSPETWRKCIKPHYVRLYGYYKSRGVLIQHHSDSVNHEIAEDMVELGIDMWQGCIPENDIKDVVKRTGGKLCIMGGIDMQKVDFPDVPEQVIRDEVRRAIDEYAPLGCFMPNISSIVALHPRTGEILHDEMNVYGAQWMARNRNH
jgi:hypothetical protein